MWSYFVFKNITRLPEIAELTCCRIDFLWHKFSVLRACLLWSRLPQSVECSESILELKAKMRDLENIDCILYRWIVRIKMFNFVTPCGCVKMFWYQCGMLNCLWLPHWYYFSVCFHRIHFSNIYRDERLVFTSFSYCAAPT